MIAKTAIRCLPFALTAVVASLLLTGCTGTDISGNPTIATDAPGRDAESVGPTVPGNVVPGIGGAAGNGGGISGGGAGVGNGH